MADLVLVPYADAMLVAIPQGVDLVSIASLSDNIVDGWRSIGPYRAELAALDEADRRVLVVGRQSIGLYAAGLAAALGLDVDYVDTDPQRLAAAEKLGATVHDRPKPDKSSGPYPVTVHTSADPAVLAATLRVTWPDGVCTDTGIYYQGAVEMPLLPMYTRGVRFVTGRVNARAVIPEVVELLEAGCDLAPAVDRVVPWDEAADVWPTMTGKTVFTALSASGDIGDEDADPLRLRAGHERQAVDAAAARGQDPRVGEVQIPSNQVQIGLAGRQHVLHPVRLPVAQRDRQRRRPCGTRSRSSRTAYRTCGPGA